MAKYVTTRKAGKYVAGHKNEGPGTVLELSGKQAEYETALGTIVPAPEEPEKPAKKPSGGKGKKTADADADEDDKAEQ